MTTSKPPGDFQIAFPERNQIHGNLWEAEFCDSMHHVSDEQNPRTYYSWIPVNTIESNPVIAAEAEGLAGKALVYIGRSNLNTEIHWNPWEYLSCRKSVFPTLALLLISWTQF